MSMYDVYISGSGISGLYAAILLTKLGLKIFVTEKIRFHASKSEVVVLSPRTLQLFQKLNLLPALIENGSRHWKFDIYQNKGSINEIKPISTRLWDNDVTEFDYCLSIEKSSLYQILNTYARNELQIQVETKQEILDMTEMNQMQHAQDLSLYYQYRSLPSPLSNQLQPYHPELFSKTIHLKNTDTQVTKSIKTKIVIAADGQSSFIRQKLGINLVKHTTKATRIFYTIQIKVISTNYPSSRQISVLNKRKNIIYIIGQDKKMYVTFEHKPNWSKVSIDEEVPVSVAIDHIKNMIDPFKIEFGKVISYKRWNAADPATIEEYCYNSSYFFVGSAAQNIQPSGLFDVNINIEQIQLLCWKLALSLNNKSTALLENSFESEARHHSSEAIVIANKFMHLIGDYYKDQDDSTDVNINATHELDFIYHLNRLKLCFVGQLTLPPNILNYTFEDQLREEFVSDENPMSPVSFTEGRSSFEFIPPSSPATNQAAAAPGSLAPNGKLKPYTLFQLLLSSNNTSALLVSPQKPSATNNLSASLSQLTTQEEPATIRIQIPPPRSQPAEPEKVERKSSKRGKSKSPTRSRSLSISSGTVMVPSNSTRSKWSVLPRLQKTLTSDATLKKRSSLSIDPPTSPSKTTKSPPVVLSSTERWKSIRPAYLQLLDRIRQINTNGTTFTLLIFAGQIQDIHIRLKHFIQRLNGSSSFISRYEDQHDEFHTNSHKLFSVVFICSSIKPDALAYLNDTPPSTVHTTFQSSGLAQVFLDHDQQCYRAYGVSKYLPEVVVIRPDGYIGTRVVIHDQDPTCFHRLSIYFDSFLRPSVDMNSAAAVVAAGFDYDF